MRINLPVTAAHLLFSSPRYATCCDSLLAHQGIEALKFLEIQHSLNSAGNSNQQWRLPMSRDGRFGSARVPWHHINSARVQPPRRSRSLDLPITVSDQGPPVMVRMDLRALGQPARAHEGQGTYLDGYVDSPTSHVCLSAPLLGLDLDRALSPHQCAIPSTYREPFPPRPETRSWHFLRLSRTRKFPSPMDTLMHLLVPPPNTISRGRNGHY